MNVKVLGEYGASTFTPSNNLHDLTSQKIVKYIQQFKLLAAAQYLQTSLK
jgi:hypothetical protein